MDDCIFCKIVNGEIPCYKIYEDSHTLAFLDIANDVYGHTLVIPKIHHKDIIQIDEKDLINTMNAVQKVSKHFINKGFDSVNLMNINELVSHFHIHLFPRKKDDGVKIYNEMPKLDLDLEEVCNELKFKEE